MSEVKVNKISPRSGTTVTLGDSGDTIAINSGASLTGFTSTGIDDNATSTAITIDSSENVGIGTGSPDAKTHILNGSDAVNILYIQGADTTTESLGFGVETGKSIISANGSGSTSNSLVFRTADAGSETERMTIDSSGNLLVGTTDTTLYSATSGGGIYAVPNGSTTIARQSNTATQPLFILNETGADGTLQEFRKDGSTVGIIGNEGTRFQLFQDTGGGFSLNSGGHAEPMNNGSRADNTMNLGGATYRFKDLYLSGSAYLGGTTSANALDDYEEGTWTPTYVPNSGAFSSITYDSETKGRYTKIGNFVFAHCFLRTDAISIGTASGFAFIGGLPFTVSLDDNVIDKGGNAISWSKDFPTNHPSSQFPKRGGTTAYLIYRSSANGENTVLDVSHLGTGADDNTIRVSIIYRAS